MLPADPPVLIAIAPNNKPEEMVVVSRDTQSDVLVSIDTQLTLIKAGKTEDALLRQAIFVTRTLSVVRPASGTDGTLLRWIFEPHLQRQICFTSITGAFSCAATEVEDLTEQVSGETPLKAAFDQAAPTANPAAESARAAAADALRARASALFAADWRFKLRPMLKAAGVSVRRRSATVGSGGR